MKDFFPDHFCLMLLRDKLQERNDEIITQFKFKYMS